MKGENLFDTIVAISTPHGLGGISIIRLSGESAIHIINKLISPKINNKTIERKLLLRQIKTIDGNNIIDNCFIALFKSPKSYTGEDLIEISCHGGFAIPNLILEELLKTDTRIATEGEFTKRAFLNNKIDLIQAESIEEMISAKTKEGVFLAQSNLEKRFSNILDNIKHNIINILSIIEMNIDYPEEDLDIVDYNEITNKISEIKQEIIKIIDDSEKGRVILSGIKVAIIGKTNVGKSSLLNCLMKEDRAIVSEHHGTTRDYLEGIINISGIPITLIDTAGIRDTSDIIEEIGTQKSKEVLTSSDIVLFLVDSTTGITQEDLSILELIKNRKTILVINKIDLKNLDINNKKGLANIKFSDIVKISAIKKISINILEKAILHNIVNITSTKNQSEILVNTRHKNLLLKLVESLNDCENSLNKNLSYEFISLDLRKSLDYLGEITGEVSSKDILDNIFENFCLGK